MTFQETFVRILAIYESGLWFKRTGILMSIFDGAYLFCLVGASALAIRALILAQSRASQSGIKPAHVLGI